MEKVLYLVRHGKAKTSSSGEKDKLRQLDADGLRQASRIGVYLYKNEPILGAIVSSDATRALETAEQLAGQIGFNISKIIANEDLYDASVRIILETVNKLNDSWDVVVLIGHNPALSYFVEYITGHHFEGMDAGSLVKIRCQTSTWQALSQGLAIFEQYLSPSDLSETT